MPTNSEIKEQRQEPFKIDMTFPTSEMLGKYILGKLETTQAWVVPIYDDTPTPVSKSPVPAEIEGKAKVKILDAVEFVCQHCEHLGKTCQTKTQPFPLRPYCQRQEEFWCVVKPFLSLIRPKLELTLIECPKISEDDWTSYKERIARAYMNGAKTQLTHDQLLAGGK